MIKTNRINQDDNLNTITEMIYELLKEEGLPVKLMNSDETKRKTTAYVGLDCLDYNGCRFAISIDRFYDKEGRITNE